MTVRHHGLRKTSLGMIGSGNVFADLGFADSETELTKANLVIAIDEAIKTRGLADAEAARIMRTPLQELRKLLRGQTETYTVESLKSC
ncbi:XRE family transcriptional regulator [Bradyrhizobium sp. 23AC]